MDELSIQYITFSSSYWETGLLFMPTEEIYDIEIKDYINLILNFNINVSNFIG